MISHHGHVCHHSATQRGHPRLMHPSVLPNLKRHAPSTRHVSTAAIKNKDSPSVITLRNSWKSQSQVPGSQEPGASLNEYMLRLRHYITSFPLPLGAQLSDVPGSGSKVFSLTTPRLQIFDFWVQPTAECTLEEAPGCVRLASDNASIRGSDTVERLGSSGALSADLHVEVAFKWDPATSGSGSGAGEAGEERKECALDAEAGIMIQVDLPMPFSMLPKPLVETTGNAALATVTPLLMSAFMSSLSNDYAAWSSSEPLRATRAKEREVDTVASR